MERIWVWGTGGPHILMENRYIDLWEADAYTEEQPLYYKTSKVDGEYIVKMSLGDGDCIVIGEEGFSTWVSCENGDGGILVISICEEEGFDENRFVETIRNIPDNEYNETGIEYIIFDSELYLFPACGFRPGGSELYNEIHLIPGKYKIKIIEAYEFDGIFVLCKFVRV